MAEEGERETDRLNKTRKCYRHSEEIETGYSKNAQLENSRTRPCTRILVFLHPKFKQHVEESVNAGQVPTWMTRTHNTHHERQVGNYRPIYCLPLMWKLLSICSEAIYGYLSSHELLPNEQKGCRKISRRMKDRLLIDKAIEEDLLI